MANSSHRRPSFEGPAFVQTRVKQLIDSHLHYWDGCDGDPYKQKPGSTITGTLGRINCIANPDGSVSWQGGMENFYLPPNPKMSEFTVSGKDALEHIRFGSIPTPKVRQDSLDRLEHMFAYSAEKKGISPDNAKAFAKKMMLNVSYQESLEDKQAQISLRNLPSVEVLLHGAFITRDYVVAAAPRVGEEFKAAASSLR